VKPRAWAVLVLAAGLAACAGPASREVLSGGESALKLRAAQTRAVEGNDRNKVLRAVVATMQDLGFMVSGADAALGTVTGRKFTSDGSGKAYDMRMTVTVRQRDSRQMLVRANAEFNNKPVEDPKAYQNFFAALGKSIFLDSAQAE
jgi:dihydroorotate dehydrogenase